MNKITRLSNNVAAPVFDRGRANSFLQDRRLARYREARRELAGRPMLTMRWRTNPASGRPECRWVADGVVVTDEGTSCRGSLRQAA